VAVIQKDMRYIIPIPREQLLLPSSIEEYVTSGHFIRFIDAFVDKELTSYADILFKKGKSLEGRPCYSPNCLCKLLIYGYFNSISSSRKLENETKRNLEAMWLMNNLTPDHWTISDFRKENKELIKQITIDFRKFLKTNGYVQGKSVSCDGSKVKAYASRDTISMNRIDKKLANVEKEIERYLSQLNENDIVENEQEDMIAISEALKEQIAALQNQVTELKSQKEMLKSHDSHFLSPVDPNAKVMKNKEGGFYPAYNVQNIVDNDTHFILASEATDHPTDYDSLEENMITLQKELDIIPEICLADGGYSNEEQIQSLEKQGIECVVPFQEETEKQKLDREHGITFTYDQNSDSFTCSQGQKLVLIQKNRKMKNHYYKKYQCKKCDECPVKQHCTTAEKGRTISKRQDEQWLIAYKEKLKTKKYKNLIKKRKSIVEHPFGTMKYYMGQIPILLRGKKKVQIEIDLYATAYNLTRLKNIENVPVLLEKLAKWNPFSLFFVFISIFTRNRRLLYPIYL